MVSFKTLTALCLISTALTTLSAEAAPITVTSSADAGGTCPGAGCTLRQAIVAASPGDTINFSLPANSTIAVTSGELVIDKSLTISGPGAKLLTVARGPSADNFRVFNIHAGITVALSGLTIANGNIGGGVGGAGIYNSGALTVADTTVAGNHSQGGGGGIFNVGTLILTRSTVSGNTTDSSGGGIYNQDNASLTITNSTIGPGNSTGVGSGGGIFSSGIALTITSSTISGNFAPGSGGFGGGGGGMSLTTAVAITSSTIAGNSAVFGGGAFLSNGGLNLRNTIIAQNTAAAGPDVYGDGLSTGFNLIGTTSALTLDTQFDNATSQLNVNPLLDTLKDNGGPTKTHALLSGSPAIDRGHSSGSNTDQRGLARPVLSPLTMNPVGDGGDIGAYEVQADQLPGCNTINRIVMNNTDGGTDSLRDILGKVCAGSVITFAPVVTGAINLTSGELLIGKSLTINGPGANVLSVQRGAGAPNFRVFDVAAGLIATIAGLTIANGSTDFGGGILNNGTLTVLDAVVSGNSATFNGGGIRNPNPGVVKVVNSTVSGNTSGINAAGLASSGTATIIGSTFSGNVASGNGGGFSNTSGTMTLVNSTIAGNTAATGGGGANSAALSVKSSIVALNTANSGPDVSGALSSEGFNVIGSAAGATITPLQFTDQIGVSAAQLNLGPLQDNGGPTPTRALLTGSVAIDKGNASGIATDQRGFARVVDLPAIGNATDGDGSDIGAFEYGSGHLDVDGNRQYDALTDGVLVIRYLFGLTGTALTSGAVGAQPARPTATEILPFLNRMNPALDVDANGSVEAATDGLMVLRYLFGYRGSVLTVDAIGVNPTRTGAQIETYIQSLMP